MVNVTLTQTLHKSTQTLVKSTSVTLVGTLPIKISKIKGGEKIGRDLADIEALHHALKNMCKDIEALHHALKNICKDVIHRMITLIYHNSHSYYTTEPTDYMVNIKVATDTDHGKI